MAVFTKLETESNRLSDEVRALYSSRHSAQSTYSLQSTYSSHSITPKEIFENKEEVPREPSQVPGSPHWAETNISTPQKAAVLFRVFRT